MRSVCSSCVGCIIGHFIHLGLLVVETKVTLFVPLIVIVVVYLSILGGTPFDGSFCRGRGSCAFKSGWLFDATARSELPLELGRVVARNEPSKLVLLLHLLALSRLSKCLISFYYSFKYFYQLHSH